MPLLPFQQLGADHLAGDRIRLLADDMGLGKTAQAIAAADTHNLPVTVLAPAMLVREWAGEIDKFWDVPRDVAIVGAKRGPDPATAGWTLCSYDRAARDDTLPMIARRVRGGHLILDEAHYLKNPDARRTKAVVGGHLTRGLTSRAERISFLTGTPSPNNAGEMFTMLRTAGRFEGSHHDFLRAYCHVRQTPFGLKVTGYRNPDAIRDMLDGFMLRRTNQVVLPASVEGEIVVQADRAADPEAVRAVHNVDPTVADMIKRAAQRGDFDRLETPHLATLRRAVGLAKAHATAKAAAALLSQDVTAKIVLFAIHRDVIAILSEYLRDFGVVELVGGTVDTKRKKLKDRFQADPETRVCVAQIKAAGTGLTLTAANHLWLVEPSWTPADNEQAKRRILRIGQTRETSIQLISLANSIDEAVNDTLRKKRQLIDEIIQDTCS